MSEILLEDWARAIRGEGLTVHFPGIPGGEWVTRVIESVARRVADTLEPGAQAVDEWYEEVTGASRKAVEEVTGLKVGPQRVSTREPRREQFAPGFLVEVPGWEEVVVLPAGGPEDAAERNARAVRRAERLVRSPTPPSVRRVAEILTTLDDLQDDAATAAMVLAVVEKAAGRAIPGVGTLATAADALNVLSSVLGPFGGPTGVRVPGRRPGRVSKRQVIEKARGDAQGYRGRIEELRRTGKLSLGWGDLIQGLQSTGNWAGVGIQLGGLVAAATDAFFGLLRGAEFRIPTKVPGVLGMIQALARARARSPHLTDVHPEAPTAGVLLGLRLLGGGARVAPWVDRLDESALAWTLVGLRLGEALLGPGLREGHYVPALEELVGRDLVVGGYRDVEDDLPMRARQVIARWAPATTAALLRAIRQVPSRERQAFYAQVVASLGWGLMADFEPEAVLRGHGPSPLYGEVMALAERDLLPLFDLGD